MDPATSDSGDYLASLGGHGDVMLWDTATWRPCCQTAIRPPTRAPSSGREN